MRTEKERYSEITEKKARAIVQANENKIEPLKQQFARMLEQREIRGKLIRNRLLSPPYKGLKIAWEMTEFMAWDDSTFLIEEQRIKAFAEYRDELVKFVLGFVDSEKKIQELEEELATEKETKEKIQTDYDVLKKQYDDLKYEHDIKEEIESKKEPKKGGRKKIMEDDDDEGPEPLL